MFPRSPDQHLFEETTNRFLDAECPPQKLRSLGTTETGYEPAYWRQGAELGWTSLVVPERAGGGSISGDGATDLALVAYQFGLHAAPGPLIATNVVAAALGRWATDAPALADLMAGEATAAWALAEPPPHDGLGDVELRATSVEGGYALEGIKTPVEEGAHAPHILVAARHETGPTLFLVPGDAARLRRAPLHGLDMTRRFARLEFDGVPVPAGSVVGELGGAEPMIRWLTDLAAAMQLAEMCGAMTWAFDTTVDWAMNRYSFGRPLASYQELKHRFADMKTWLEASLAIAGRAAQAIDGDAPDRAEQVSAGKFYVGRYGVELMQDCVQIHGGIGVTYDHDLHLFLRRVVTDSQLYGTPTDHALRLADLLEERPWNP